MFKSLPKKYIITSDGVAFSVPKYIRRLEYDGKRYWQVEPGPSGVFTDEAVRRSFSDNHETKDAAASLNKAIEYLQSIYLRPSLASKYGKRKASTGFMPIGMELKLRRHPPQVVSPCIWVIVIRESYRGILHQPRDYVIIGEDGNISQERFVEAMNHALLLKAARMAKRIRMLEARGHDET